MAEIDFVRTASPQAGASFGDRMRRLARDLVRAFAPAMLAPAPKHAVHRGARSAFRPF